MSGKKKRFRPTKFLKKVFSGGGHGGSNSGTRKLETTTDDSSIQHSNTLETAYSVTYEPPSPERFQNDKDSEPTTTTTTTTTPSSSPAAVIAAQRKSATVRDVIQGKDLQRRDSGSISYSSKISDWDEMPSSKKVFEWEESPSTTMIDWNESPSKKEEKPFDESTVGTKDTRELESKDASVTNIERSNSMPSEEVVDVIYQELEDLKPEKHRVNVSVITHVPNVVSVPSPRASPVPILPSPSPTVQNDNITTSITTKTTTTTTKSGLRWKVLPDGSLDEVREVQLEPPVLEDEKKEDHDVPQQQAPPVMPPMSFRQRARSLNQLRSAGSMTSKDSTEVRRNTSYSTTPKDIEDDDQTNPTQIMNDLEQQEKIHQYLKPPVTEDPLTFVSAYYQIKTVPETVDEDTQSLSEAVSADDKDHHVATYETDEGTEVFSTFARQVLQQQQPPQQQLYKPMIQPPPKRRSTVVIHDDDEDTTFDLEEGPDDEVDEQMLTLPRRAISPETITLVDEEKQLGFREHGMSEDHNTNITLDYSLPSQPRRIMGRSPESLEAEVQHGSLSSSPPHHHDDKGHHQGFGSKVSLNSIKASTDYFRVTQTRGMSPTSWVSSNGGDGHTEYGSRPSSPADTKDSAYTSIMSGYQNDDDDDDDDCYTTTSRTVTSQTVLTLRGGPLLESDDEDDEVQDDFANFQHELTEMASELVNNGPAVLMDWMDLRPMK